MLDKTDECSRLKCSKAELFEKLFFYQWADEAQPMKRSLMTLLVTYLKSDVVDEHDKALRQDIGNHVMRMIEIIETLEEHARAKGLDYAA